MKTLRSLSLSLILLWTLILNVYHAGVYPHPPVDLSETATARWMDRREAGIHQLILEGPPFARGREAGKLVVPLLREQETALVTQLRGWVPSNIILQGLILGAITWFQGAEKYLDLPFTQEMYGTSFSAPKEFDYLADGFTRQVAYHGLHEVGQKMVDQGFEDMGCTVVAIPWKTGYVLGRNFDFEGGRIFDSEKILKWVFPDKGYSFVSVIWAGMVGAVTGVNENGVYISINAGGSADERRIGTPSTLVLLKVLQEAKTREDALDILEREQMFITDIFVVLDTHGHLYRIEKSPKKMAVLPMHGPSVVTNHLVAPEFADDPTNSFRRAELTSVVRERRGLDLLHAMKPPKTETQSVSQVLAILRDKGVDEKGQPLSLSNRRAIDALIATHSVIYDPDANELFVSQGPAVSGPFLGYDLRASFKTHTPVRKGALPSDPLVSTETFNAIKEANLKISRAHRLIQFKMCKEGRDLLSEIDPKWTQQSPFYFALGDAQDCLQDHTAARVNWQRALDLSPAYARFERSLKAKLAK